MGKKYGGEINLTARFYGLDGTFGRDSPKTSLFSPS
jgi:hypothetical protein